MFLVAVLCHFTPTILVQIARGLRVLRLSEIKISLPRVKCMNEYRTTLKF